MKSKDINNLLPEFKSDFDYEDPMSRPRVTLIGELKISKDKNLKKIPAQDIQVSIVLWFQRYEYL